MQTCFLGCDTNELMNTQGGLVGKCQFGMPRAGSCSDRMSNWLSFDGSREDGESLSMDLFFLGGVTESSQGCKCNRRVLAT